MTPDSTLDRFERVVAKGYPTVVLPADEAAGLVRDIRALRAAVAQLRESLAECYPLVESNGSIMWPAVEKAVATLDATKDIG